MTQAGTTSPSVGELVGSLVAETGTLVRQELQLASTELGHKAKRAAANVGFVWIGAVLAHAGLLFLATAIVLGLAAFVPMWTSALAVGIVAMGTGIAFVRRGMHALRDIDPVPQRTLQTVQSAAASMKEQFR